MRTMATANSLLLMPPLLVVLDLLLHLLRRRRLGRNIAVSFRVESVIPALLIVASIRVVIPRSSIAVAGPAFGQVLDRVLGWVHRHPSANRPHSALVAAVAVAPPATAERTPPVLTCYRRLLTFRSKSLPRLPGLQHRLLLGHLFHLHPHLLGTDPRPFLQDRQRLPVIRRISTAAHLLSPTRLTEDHRPHRLTIPTTLPGMAQALRTRLSTIPVIISLLNSTTTVITSRLPTQHHRTTQNRGGTRFSMRRLGAANTSPIVILVVSRAAASPAQPIPLLIIHRAPMLRAVLTTQAPWVEERRRLGRPTLPMHHMVQGLLQSFRELRLEARRL